MNKVELLTVKDGKEIIISDKTKTVYTVTRKENDYVMVTAVKSQLTLKKKKDLLVTVL